MNDTGVNDTGVNDTGVNSVSQSSFEWSSRGESVAHEGFAFGSRYPSLTFRFGGPAVPLDLRAKVEQLLATSHPEFEVLESVLELGELALDPAEQDWRDTLGWMLRLFDALQIACSLPVYEPARALQVEPPEAHCQIACCKRSLVPLSGVLGLVLKLIKLAGEGAPTDDCMKQLKMYLKALNGSGFSGGNVPRFIRAAHDLGIPFKEQPGQFFRFGDGRSGFWMDSSFTQNTGHIASKVAGDKVICSAVLRGAGLPAPRCLQVLTEEQALKVADALGFPVVVKPADTEGGRGVSVNLNSVEEVTRAFKLATTFSKRIMVEKHVHGSDYRLTVHRGELIWAVERVPASVTGNGSDTIAVLVAQENLNPARCDSIHAPLKPITLDDDAIAFLAAQGLSPDIVPDAGQQVPLKRAANVSTGGMPIAVFDHVHPDNAELAIAAAQAVRLDLAGIDLLMPDISLSYRQTGAGICEINGLPQIGGTTSAHIYPQILRREVRGSGRIPTVVLLGPSADDVDLIALRAGLEEQGLTIGWHNSDCVQVGSRTLVRGEVEMVEAGEMLAANADVDVMILTVNSTRVLTTGLPVARFDLAIDCGSAIKVEGTLSEAESAGLLGKFIRTILPACDGGILAGAELQAALTSAGAEISADIKPLEPDAPLPVRWLIDCITLLHSEHSGGG